MYAGIRTTFSVSLMQLSLAVINKIRCSSPWKRNPRLRILTILLWNYFDHKRYKVLVRTKYDDDRLWVLDYSRRALVKVLKLEHEGMLDVI